MSCPLPSEGQGAQQSPRKIRSWRRYLLLLLVILGLCDLAWRVTQFAWEKCRPEPLPANPIAALIRYANEKSPYVLVIREKGYVCSFLVGIQGETRESEVVLGTGHYDEETAEVRLDDVPRWSSCWDIISGPETDVQYDWSTSEPKGVHLLRNLEALGETKDRIAEIANHTADGTYSPYPFDKAIWLYGVKKGWFRPSQPIAVITVWPKEGDLWGYEVVYARRGRYVFSRDSALMGPRWAEVDGNINIRTFEIEGESFYSELE